MKKLMMMAALVLFTFTLRAQNQVEMMNGNKAEGQFRNEIPRNGTIVFTGADNKKQVLDATMVKSASIENQVYLSYRNDFFLEVYKGEKLSLYQKVTDNDGKIIYNGTVPVSISGSEGRKGDYFVQTGTGSGLSLVRKKDFIKSIQPFIGDCSGLSADLEAGKFSYSDLPKIMGAYHSCK